MQLHTVDTKRLATAPRAAMTLVASLPEGVHSKAAKVVVVARSVQ